MDLELRLLECAIALAEHGNFARAAKAIHMSQPTLSRNIQELERRLGVELFSRTQRGVEPTTVGEVVLERGRDVVSRSQDLVREIDLFRGMEKGDLSLGTGIYASPMFVDKAVARFVRDCPNVHIAVTNGHGLDLLPRLLRREMDLAVLYHLPRGVDPQIHVTRLNPHPAHFVVRTGHPLLDLRRNPTLDQILRYPISGTSRLPAPLVKQFIAANPNARSMPSVTCESLEMIKAIIAESDTVGLLPLNVVLPAMKDGTMAIVPYAQAIEPPPAFSIVHLQNRSLSPLGEKLVNLIIEADQELSEIEEEFAARTPRKRA